MAILDLLLARPFGFQSVLQKIVAAEIKRESLDERLAQLTASLPSGTVEAVTRFLQSHESHVVGTSLLVATLQAILITHVPRSINGGQCASKRNK